MSKDFSLYPTLNKRIFSKLEYMRSNISFEFSSKGEKHSITIEDSIHGSQIILNDQKGVWDASVNDLQINLDLQFEDLNVLFEKDGLVGSNSKIGIAVEWYSSPSKQRGTVILGVVDNEDSKRVFIDKSIYFEKGMMRKAIDLNFFMYIEKTDGELSQDESYKANQKGYLLGTFDTLNLIIEGEGTDFPLTTYFDKDGPLWRIVCNWDDPTIDMFEDTISINLNRAHKNHKYIDSEHKNFNSVLMDEIIYNALEIIINKVKNSIFMVEIQNNNFEDGSVAASVAYFIQTFELNLSSEESLALSLRNKIKLEN